MSQTPAIALIGLDWGSTNLRAYAFDAVGNIVDRTQSDAGALKLKGDLAFDAALVALIGGWARSYPAATLIACGMLGARTGWREAPYVDCGIDAASAQEKAGLAQRLALGVASVATSLGRPLTIVPGMNSSEPDVMRGEETQIVGSDVANGIVICPGTHSKWIHVASHQIESFATFFTGEMHALIRDNSSVGKALNTAPTLDDGQSFHLGLSYARSGAASWLHDLFVMRAAVVTGTKTPEQISTVLSGWLLGCEFAAALSMYPETQEIALLASDALVPWYERAGEAFGVKVNALDSAVATARGLWRIAQNLT
ncbi:MAG: 2-dehydro-3-deoxygalactonokinase [Casimicrobium sp.]